MIEYSLSVLEWLKLSTETRSKLSEIFQIPKSRGAQIETMGETSVVKSDGTTHEDLQAITVEKMQLWLKDESTSDYLTLFNAVINKLEEDKELEVGPVIDYKTLLLDEWIAIFNRLKGQSVEHQMEKELEIAIRQIFNIKNQQNAEFSQGLPSKTTRTKKVK